MLRPSSQSIIKKMDIGRSVVENSHTDHVCDVLMSGAEKIRCTRQPAPNGVKKAAHARQTKTNKMNDQHLALQTGLG